jgi:ThiF family
VSSFWTTLEVRILLSISLTIGASKSAETAIQSHIVERDNSTSLHWLALEMPVVSYGEKYANGFRSNEQGYWTRDKREVFRASEPISWVQSENWHTDQLSTRGRLPSSLSQATVAMIGVGAVGSSMAELLMRGGVQKLIVVDDDVFAAGNLVRHTLLIENIGDLKARSVAERLKLASPHAVVESMDSNISSLSSEEWANLESCSVLIDCTGSDEVLFHLAEQRGTAERVYVSVSIGLGARRLFVFIARGSAFPHMVFRQVIQPWLERGRQECSGRAYPWAGIGCWHPVFPARADDIWLLTSLALKSIESILETSSLRTQLAVFEAERDDSGFIGVRLVAREFANG